MKKEAVMKYVKAVAGILSCAGIVVSPDMQLEITTGFIAAYSLLSMIQGKFKKDDDK